MFQIKATDLQIAYDEQQKEEQKAQGVVKLIADLAVENKKKDMAIQQLTKTVSGLNLEIQKLKGGTTSV